EARAVRRVDARRRRHRSRARRRVERVAVARGLAAAAEEVVAPFEGGDSSVRVPTPGGRQRRGEPAAVEAAVARRARIAAAAAAREQEQTRSQCRELRPPHRQFRVRTLISVPLLIPMIVTRVSPCTQYWSVTDVPPVVTSVSAVPDVDHVPAVPPPKL